MDELHFLEQFEGAAGEPASSAWVVTDDARLERSARALLQLGLAVRLSCVGYGRALRVSVTDSRGWTCGWTVGSPQELHALLGGLLAPGLEEYLQRRLEKPRRFR